jgi:hypothetical protein
VDDDTTAVNMFEELEPETLTLTRSLDKPWNILDHERSIFPLHDPKVWNESREGVVCNFWLDVGKGLDDSRFSSIWESNDTNISNELKFQFYITCFAFVSEFRKVWCLSCTGREVCIAKSTTSSLTDEKLLSRT